VVQGVGPEFKPEYRKKKKKKKKGGEGDYGMAQVVELLPPVQTS
jgi:hypothetical protein